MISLKLGLRQAIDLRSLRNGETRERRAPNQTTWETGFNHQLSNQCTPISTSIGLLTLAMGLWRLLFGALTSFQSAVFEPGLALKSRCDVDRFNESCL